MKIHKYEAFGIGIAVALMATALFFMRFNDTLTRPAGGNGSSQSASVILAEGGEAGVVNALSEAVEGGRVTKVVATDVVIGNGEEVEKGDQIQIHYIATLQNGQEFDNTHKKGESLSLTVGDKSVIEGLNEGVVGMKAGGQRIIIIPAEKAYGREGYGPIPGKATVVYAVELISIK
ncbi:MAG: FKBP-type peptidyl-prolyl cis-trans isomerase [Candidatus Paceibacterota bacterium]